MSEKVKHFLLMIVSTVAMWLAAMLMDLVTSSSGMSNFAALIAFLASIALWITWGFTQFDSSQSQESSEKAKREAHEDSRVALLLELLDEDKRRALKQRLIEDLSSDGEAVSLADLLAAEKRTGQRAGR